ncbi:MAG: hypothetical protein WD226_08195 [Planctomycetota bacterium]
MRGAYWQGWISSDLERLVVAVEGLGIAEFRPRPTTDGKPELVFVGQRSPVTLQFLDLPAGGRGIDLSIQVLRSTTDGLHAERSAVARTDASGHALLDLGDATDL